MNIKEFEANKPSQHDFLKAVFVSFIAVYLIIFLAMTATTTLKRILSRFAKKKIYDIENQ